MTENRSQVTSVSENRNGLGLYFLLLAVQTAGAAIVLVHGVPIYRKLAGDFANHRPDPGILWWAVVAVVLIQTSYWIRMRLQPRMPRNAHVVLGHLASFVARLSFIFASSSFTVLFLVRFDQLSLPPHRILMVFALLFSLFCYTLELERLARSLHSTEGKI